MIPDPPDVLIVSHPRSGTHFLQASLASHPRVHGRGEFFLRYLRHKQSTGYVDPTMPMFNNTKALLNVGIVMYAELEEFERLYGRLDQFKILHLLRCHKCTGRSVAQMEANRVAHGRQFKAHYHLHESPLPHARISPELVKKSSRRVKRSQSRYIQHLNGHPDIFVCQYEQIASGCQVNTLDTFFTITLLHFLSLPYAKLSNCLKKS